MPAWQSAGNRRPRANAAEAATGEHVIARHDLHGPEITIVIYPPDADLLRIADALAEVTDDHAIFTTLRGFNSAQSEAMTLPRKEVLIALLERWRELVDSIELLPDNPQATAEDTETARMHLHTLLGTVTLKPGDGILWAHPA